MLQNKNLTSKQVEEVNFDNVVVRSNKAKRSLLRLASYSRNEHYYLKKLSIRMVNCNVFEINKLSNLKKLEFNGTNELPLAIGLVLDRMDNRILDVHELDKKLVIRTILMDKYEYGPTLESIDNFIEFSCDCGSISRCDSTIRMYK